MSTPHRLVVVGVLQAVVHHGVVQDGVAEAIAVPGTQQQVRGRGHGLHATRDHYLGVTRADHQVGLVDGVETGEADLVDHGRRGRHGDAGGGGRLPGGDLTGPSQEDLAHDHVVDLLGPGVGSLEGGPDGDGAEIGGREGGEGSRQLPDRGAGAGDNDRTRHDR